MDMKHFLQEQKLFLMQEYEDALDRNNYFLAKNLRAKIVFIDELIRGVS